MTVLSRATVVVASGVLCAGFVSACSGIGESDPVVYASFERDSRVPDPSVFLDALRASAVPIRDDQDAIRAGETICDAAEKNIPEHILIGHYRDQGLTLEQAGVLYGTSITYLCPIYTTKLNTPR